MSTEENKALVRRFYDEVVNQGNMAVADTLLAQNIVDHAALPGTPPDREGFKQSITMFRNAVPDLHFTVEDMIAEGDKVTVRWTSTGTQQGMFMGIPPTGKRATVTGIDIFRIANGKIEEDWSNWDMLGLLQQLGVMPAPGQGGS